MSLINARCSVGAIQRIKRSRQHDFFLIYPDAVDVMRTHGNIIMNSPRAIQQLWKDYPGTIKRISNDYGKTIQGLSNDYGKTIQGLYKDYGKTIQRLSKDYGKASLFMEVTKKN